MIYQTIFDEKILEKLAPRILITTQENKEILEVLGYLIQKYILDNMKYLVFYDRIDTMSAKELDAVAEELHIDFYDYTLDIEKKREACKSSFAIHSIKGTPSAVKKVLNIFFRNSTLEQWYEYGGEPGYFKVKIDGKVPTNMQEIAIKIEDAKKKSQHLEKIIFSSECKGILYAGSHLRQGYKGELKPNRFTLTFRSSNMEVKSSLDQHIVQKQRRNK